MKTNTRNVFVGVILMIVMLLGISMLINIFLLNRN